MRPSVAARIASVCFLSLGPGSTTTYSVAPGARNNQVLVPSSVIWPGLSASSTAAVGVT